MTTIIKHKTKEFLNRHYSLKGKLKIIYYSFKAFFDNYKISYAKGSCNICGKNTFFFGFWSKRETFFCWYCGSNSRNRALAKVVLENYGNVNCLNEFNKDHKIKGYLAAAYGPLAEILRHRNFTLSEYFQDTKLGDRKGDIICQNLTSLTFEDNSFDLVISEAVIEHINSPLKSFIEVNRVLRKNGKYIFSIPFESDLETTTRVLPDGTALCERKYHKDPLSSSGALVYTDFSKNDFEEKMLRPSGFFGKILNINDSNAGIYESDIIIAKKMSSNNDINN